MIGREGWPAGPWDDEPEGDKFQHAGLICELQRNNLGAWCGYVLLPPSHPLSGVNYGDCELEAHGGITFSDYRGSFWAFGFDCAHAGDLVPGMLAAMQRFGIESCRTGTYRDLQFARNECRRLAEQLAAVRSAPRRRLSAPEEQPAGVAGLNLLFVRYATEFGTAREAFLADPGAQTLRTAEIAAAKMRGALSVLDAFPAGVQPFKRLRDYFEQAAQVIDEASARVTVAIAHFDGSDRPESLH